MPSHRWSLMAGCIALCLVLLGSSASAGDWPQFRGPGGTAVSDEKGLPEKWSAKENLRWKVELPGRGVSNPVVAGGRVYVTACTGYREDRLHVLSFDAASGKKLWERQFWATGHTQCHPKTCMAGPTPVTDGQHVYALFATGDLFCLDKNGDLVWYRALVPDYPTIGNNVGMAASPILYKDVLLLPMENVGESFAAGLDKRTGRNLWRAERARDINWVTPLLIPGGKGTEVLFQSKSALTAYEPESGKKLWEYADGSLTTIPSPTMGKGTILVPASELLALKPGQAGTAPEVVWKSNKFRSGYASPLYYQDRVYSVTQNALLCGDAADGKLLWQERVEGPFSASPVAADGKVYLLSEKGTATVVQVGDQPKVLAVNRLEETMLATPAIANGAIYLRSDGYLYCISGKK